MRAREIREKIDKINKLRDAVLEFIESDFVVEYGFMADFEKPELLDFEIGRKGEVEFNFDIPKFRNMAKDLVNIHTHSTYPDLSPSEIYPSLDDFSIMNILKRYVNKFMIISSEKYVSYFEFLEHSILIICKTLKYPFDSVIRIDYPDIFDTPYLTPYHLTIYHNIINTIDQFYKELGYSIKENWNYP